MGWVEIFHGAARYAKGNLLFVEPNKLHPGSSKIVLLFYVAVCRPLAVYPRCHPEANTTENKSSVPRASLRGVIQNYAVKNRGRISFGKGW
jgi:hypothetical protein